MPTLSVDTSSTLISPKRARNAREKRRQHHHAIAHAARIAADRRGAHRVVAHGVGEAHERRARQREHRDASRAGTTARSAHKPRAPDRSSSCRSIGPLARSIGTPASPPNQSGNAHAAAATSSPMPSVIIAKAVPARRVEIKPNSTPHSAPPIPPTNGSNTSGTPIRLNTCAATSAPSPEYIA